MPIVLRETCLFLNINLGLSAVRCRIWPKFEVIREFMVVLIKNEDPIQNEGARVATITLWEPSVAMETRALIRSGPKPNAAFPLPQ